MACTRKCLIIWWLFDISAYPKSSPGVRLFHFALSKGILMIYAIYFLPSLLGWEKSHSYLYKDLVLEIDSLYHSGYFITVYITL